VNSKKSQIDELFGVVAAEFSLPNKAKVPQAITTK
jgi:hypothetical protein